MRSYPLSDSSSGFLAPSRTRFPILLFLASANDQSVDIKWIDKSLDPTTGIIIARALNFRNTIFSEINLV